MSTSMEFTTPSADRCSPWIPPELISLILVELWQQQHTPQDRSTLLVNIALVNRTWLALIAHIASRDVHLSSFKDTVAFLGLLPKGCPARERCDLLTIERKRATNQSCRELTCHVDGTMRENLPADVPVDISLVFLDPLHFPSHLPNLRHISISHTDWAFDQIFLYLQLGFPKQVTHLSLDYSFTVGSGANAPPFDPARALQWISMQPLTLPNLRHISLSGVPAAFAALVLDVCPNVETLELTHPGELFNLAPLPPATRTLVLRCPGVALSKRKMRLWLLPTALDEGLFPTMENSNLKPPRIIVRSGTPDPVSFTWLRVACKRFKVDLVYERDDSRSPLD